VSVPAYCSATRSNSADLERELAVADAHAISRVQRPGCLQTSSLRYVPFVEPRSSITTMLPCS